MQKEKSQPAVRLETEIHKKVRATISTHRMLNKGDRVVVGVSGGPDSVTLLYILSSLKDEYSLDLHVAHLNHCLRGEESRHDALFVEDLARRLNLPLISEEVDVRAEKKTSALSLEALARKERYDFFLAAARETGASKVALGHQADDVIETLLMHLVRGSGPGGLVGIPAVRSLSGEVILIRPLLRIRSSQIEGYLKERKIPSRHDSTNLDPIHLRNRIRHELIPKLEEYNPRFRQAITRSLNLWLRDDEYLGSLARDILDDLLLEESKGKIVLNLNGFNIHQEPIGFRFIREALSLLKGDLEGITYNHIEAITGLIREGPSQGRLDLPHGIRVVREYDRLKLHVDEEDRGVGQGFFEHSLNLPGKTSIPEQGLLLEAEILPANGFTARGLKEISTDSTVYLDYDRIKTPLSIRSRLEGDHFSPLGMEGMRKKLKDFFIDLKIPAPNRDQIPLLLDRVGVIWVLGYRIDERVKITQETERILRISYKGKEQQ